MKWFVLFAIISGFFHWFGGLFYRLLKYLLPSVAKKWDSCQPPCKKISINLVIGLGIMMVIIFFQDLPWLIEAEDASMDWMMELNQKIIPSKAGKNIPAFVFLDVDDKTYHSWGEPLFTPRDRLKNMIETSIAAKPRLVLVDIDVSQPTPVVDEASLHPNDQILKDYLENYATECKRKTDGSSCPPIILARAFQVNVQPDKPSYPIPRTGFLEEVVANGAPYLQWASAHFFHAEDQVIRRWMLWQPACTIDKQPIVAPSFELAVMANIQQGCSVANMQDELSKFRPKDCDNVVDDKEVKSEVKICSLITSTDIRNINQRVNYKIPWLPANDGLGESDTLVTQADEPVLTIFSAEHFATLPSQVTQENLEKLMGSIVVIGGSYLDARDVHLTPLEEMPGALIIINAIHSLLTLDEGTIQPLNIYLRLLIMAILIVIMSILLIKFDSAWGKMISGVSLILILLLPAILLYEQGIWMDYTIPLLIVQLYQIMNDFEEMRQMRKKRRLSDVSSNKS